MTTVKDLYSTINHLSHGRCVKTTLDYAVAKNPFIVTKTSDIPGKSITELPGLICGDPDAKIKKVAVMMTLTESAIELAAASGVDAIITHHPVGDACSCGGGLLRNYLELYHIALFELHEAFHDLHPGIPFLHAHQILYSDFHYGGILGNIVYVGEVFPNIHKLGDILDRLDYFMRIPNQRPTQYENSLSLHGEILIGDRDTPVKKVIHVFPHTGFTPEHLEEVVSKFPDIDTVIVSASRVYPGHPLLEKSKQLGLHFLCGNVHSLEIYENGLPLAYALKDHLPELELVLFEETMTSIPLGYGETTAIQKYGRYMAKKYLTP